MENNNLEQIISQLLDETPENIIGVSYGYKTKNGQLTDEKSIIFNVDKKLPISELNSEDIIPNTLDFLGETFSTDVVEMKVELLNCPSSFLKWQNPLTPPSNRNRIRPLKGGISVTNASDLLNSRGTLGFFAVDNETNSLVAVSNNHVLIKEAFINSEKNALYTGPSKSIADEISGSIACQPAEPGQTSFESIGFIKRYKPIYKPPIANRADVAITTVSQSEINPSTSYLMEGITGWTQPLQFANSSEIDSLLSGNNNLFSAGRTTGPKGEGLTKLKVSAYPVSFYIVYNRHDAKEPVLFERAIQFIASASTTPTGQICPWPAAPGDSGSALVADFGGVRKIVGLVFAGSVPLNDGNSYLAFANRIDDVAQAINISAWTGQTVNYTNMNTKEIHIVQGMSSDETLVLSGKTFWQVGYR